MASVATTKRKTFGVPGWLLKQLLTQIQTFYCPVIRQVGRARQLGFALGMSWPLTSIDTATDIAYEPRHESNIKELKPRRADELKPHRRQSLPHSSLRPYSPCQMNPWIQQPCPSFPFFLLKHMFVDVILNSIEFVTANAC